MKMIAITHWRSDWILALGAVLLLMAAPGSWAQLDEEEDEEGPIFEEAFVFAELNNTDGDLGLHSKIDGDAWKRLRMINADGHTILRVKARGSLASQGMTEFFFESAEPTFDELTPEEFFERFPEGVYHIQGLSNEGEHMNATSDFSHLMPAPPQPSVNGVPFVEDCDEGELPVFEAEDVVITWPAITMSHSELGRTNEPIEVHNYEVVVEIDETPWVVQVVLPPDVTSFEVPEEILALGDEIKYEVLVREASYNQTATESCFEVESEDDGEDDD